MKVLNEAVDEERRKESKTQPELAKNRYMWLKNPGNYAKGRRKIDGPNPAPSEPENRTGVAYHPEFSGTLPTAVGRGIRFLKRWYWATHSRLERIKLADANIRRHCEEILKWFSFKLTNGIVEGLNSLIQAAKARLRGYRTATNLIDMNYLLGARPDFALHT